MFNQLTTDILILGTGGAGLMAALHAFWRDPSLDITLVSKGGLGKSGCTRMVQGGYNVVLDPKDSIQAHFEDTVRGGAYLNDQDLALTLVEDAPRSPSSSNAPLSREPGTTMPVGWNCTISMSIRCAPQRYAIATPSIAFS